MTAAGAGEGRFPSMLGSDVATGPRAPATHAARTKLVRASTDGNVLFIGCRGNGILHCVSAGAPVARESYSPKAQSSGMPIVSQPSRRFAKDASASSLGKTGRRSGGLRK